MTANALALGIPGWDQLVHGGLLLDEQRQRDLARQLPQELPWFQERDLRRAVLALAADTKKERPDVGEFVAFVLHVVCGFPAEGWQRGSQVGSEWSRRSSTGELHKPRHLWRGPRGALLPVFFDSEPRLGIGRSRQTISHVLQWLRAGSERLALLTNGHQWRLVFAGLDFDAFCQWDTESFLVQGALSEQLEGFRTLITPDLWTPAELGEPSPLLAAIQQSRKGQADLSAALGERVREAVELLMQAHGEVLHERCAAVDPADIYRAAVRVVMRMVVVLFAEARELLPRDNPQYHGVYGLQGLREELARQHTRGTGRLARSWSAWPRVLALFRLVHQGSHHPALCIPAYGGELFGPGDPASPYGIQQALAVFEGACFEAEVLPDRDVHRMLDLITRTEVRIRQGRSSIPMKTAIDFSDLSSEYIGILYEGLLDFELRQVPAGDPIVFLAVGNEPALPMSRLEAMDDKTIESLLQKLKKAAKRTPQGESDDEDDADGDADDDTETDDAEADGDDDADGADAVEEIADTAEPEPDAAADLRHTHRTRAEVWARRAVDLAKLVKKPRGRQTPERALVFEQEVGIRARQLVRRVVLPGEWYLVRWGGTRKGSGTFYTRPGLAVPTVQRALRPLAYVPPAGADGQPNWLAHEHEWAPKLPEQILALKVCDPACGSGSFLVASLRFLCDALYTSLHAHGRIEQDGDRAIVQLLGARKAAGDGHAEGLGTELLPCRPDDPTFEARLEAVLRRYVVEQCVYGVDVDPLAVELCRLALWIETMDRHLPFTFLDHKLRPGDALIGAWLDRFRDYPLLAWWRQSPDEKWRGVSQPGDVWSKALKSERKKRVDEQADVIREQRLLARQGISDAALQQALAHLRDLYARLHAVPPSQPDERARIWRDEVQCDPALQRVKAACDLWTALWFWPLDRLQDAPGPPDLGAPSAAAQDVVARLVRQRSFFHWELEFPDVFVGDGSGFDAVVGNPPWEIQKPSSKEFFSDLDPLYRSYGKQEALRRQRELFEQDAEVERRWLEHVGVFKDKGNFVRHAAAPFGDGGGDDGREGITLVPRRAEESEALHRRWAAARAERRGCADPRHAYRHQGSADLNTYKLFVEQAHALLRDGGYLALITPSGLYTDKGSVELRRLLLDQCTWRWLYGFENRDKVFDIDSRFKFAVTIAQKGGKTTAIRAAFMRHDLADWAEAKGALEYPAERVRAFSPKSLSVLELADERSLDLMWRISTCSVPLSTTPNLKYVHAELLATADSKTFVLRERAEVDGYKPTAHGLWERGAPAEALVPIIEGRMVDTLHPNAMRWVRGKGRGAVWQSVPPDAPEIWPQYFLPLREVTSHAAIQLGWKLTLMDVTSATNCRTIVAAPEYGVTSIDSCRHLVPADGSLTDVLRWAAVTSSLVFDWMARVRVGGLHVTWFQLADMLVPRSWHDGLLDLAARLAFASPRFCHGWIELRKNTLLTQGPPCRSAVQSAERTRLLASVDAVAATLYELSRQDLHWILRDCDHPRERLTRKRFRRTLDPKGFWRIDKDKDPELRHTVLTLVAFDDLQKLIAEHGGDRDKGIAAFLAQNNGEGWMLPGSLRLADYGLGHDDRAQHPQPVASRLGPRFLDWQLAQTPEESWAECERHAKAILGKAEPHPGASGATARTVQPNAATSSAATKQAGAVQKDLFRGPHS